jgi:hypothetical protein
MRTLTLSLAAIWAVVTTAMLIELPRVDPTLLYISLSFIVYYFVMSAALQVSSPRSAPIQIQVAKRG